MSASLFNHKVIVADNKISPTMSRAVGYVINQDLVEKEFGKCAYIWDGADSKNLNGGCGRLQPGDCNDTLSAFANLCTHDPTEPHTCTRSDWEVESVMCKGGSGADAYGSVDPPTTASGPVCYYEMPALMTDDITSTNHLRDTLKQRITFQGSDSTLTATWNEVVLDNHLLIPKIRSNPTNTILAFVCVPSADPDSCHKATQMRDGFNTEYKVSGSGPPVVALDTAADISHGGPFIVPPTLILA